MPRRARPEDALQKAVVQMLKLCLVPGTYWHAVPNGGLRSKLEAAIMVGLGVRAGAPDLVVYGPDARAHFMELKSASGRLSPEQREVRDWAIAHGLPHAVIRSLDDARDFLAANGLLRNMRIAA